MKAGEQAMLVQLAHLAERVRALPKARQGIALDQLEADIARQEIGIGNWSVQSLAISLVVDPLPESQRIGLWHSVRRLATLCSLRPDLYGETSESEGSSAETSHGTVIDLQRERARRRP